jgi:hypothetical protein
MAVPKPVSKKLRDMLGTEAADMMVDWLDQRERHYEELRQEARADTAELRQEMRVGFAALEAKMGELKAEILKWAMGFWIGSLLAIVAALVTLSRVSH